MGILKKSQKPLTAVGSLAIGYIVISAIIVFNIEPETYNSFFDAIYWAACTLTTVGYGDVYPVTITGRVISMISAVVGIALIALPSGIITSAYLDELRSRRS
jgi:voltage-gated potassium channel